MKNETSEYTGPSVKKIKESKRLELTRQKLSSPVEFKWPQLTDEVDHQIQLRLRRAFEPYKKCLRKVKNRLSWMVYGDWASDMVPLTSKEEENKREFKKLFYFGISSVIRGLEKDELRLVLIWKATQPSELKKAVLSLVIRTGCPAASISDVLHPVKASYECLSSLTAMGVKKSADPNIFDDLVEYVKSEVPVIDIPEIPKMTRSIEDLDEFKHNNSMHIDVGNTCDASQKNDLAENVTEKKVKSSSKSETDMEKSMFNSSKTISNIKETSTQWSKYDILIHEKKSFAEQDIIKFPEDKCSNVIEVDDETNYDMCFGIAASLIVSNDSGMKEDRTIERNNVRNKGKKRKFKSNKNMTETSSGYKELSIKQLKSNPNKRKKKKFKLKKVK